MSSFNGYIRKYFPAIAFLFLLSLPQRADCQISILDSTFTFSAGLITTGDALTLISSQTGYNFTYDSRLINTGKMTEMNFTPTALRTVLNKILQNDSLLYSVIDKYIIISRSERREAAATDSLPRQIQKFITGVITDTETNERLPFATIALKNSGRGTVSNKNGEFRLNIIAGQVDDTLSISFLGYKRCEKPLSQVKSSPLIISMEREFISIPEIIIRNQIPQEIIARVKAQIAFNYGTTPVLMTGFYREGVTKKNELQTYSEAVIQIYKSAYSGTLLNDQIKIYKSRKIDNANLSDTLAVRLKAGLSTCLDLDGARNTFDFLAAANLKDYKYMMTDIVTYDEEAAFAIEFEQREDIDLPLFKGTIYINTSDYGILNAEFELNKTLIRKLKDSFVTSSTHGFNTWPVTVKYSVSYRKMNGRYFLSHVRGDLLFSSDRKKIFFNTQFRVFFELAITEIQMENVARFDREELAPVHSIFSKTINSYDPAFWGDQDFLKPEDNLLRALKNMNVRLQEFQGK
jgi:hypothetical protein